MKKEIYSRSGYQHGLFSRGNFERYIKKMNDKLRLNIKAAKHNKSGMNVYSIKEIKNVEENAKFVKSFSEKFNKENKTE